MALTDRERSDMHALADAWTAGAARGKHAVPAFWHLIGCRWCRDGWRADHGKTDPLLPLDVPKATYRAADPLAVPERDRGITWNARSGDDGIVDRDHLPDDGGPDFTTDVVVPLGDRVVGLFGRYLARCQDANEWPSVAGFAVDLLYGIGHADGARDVVNAQFRTRAHP